MLPREKVQLLQDRRSALKKKQQEQKIPNQTKSHRNLVLKQKVLKKKSIVIARLQKWLQGPAAD